MLDPTNSRYRFIEFKGASLRRFEKNNDNLVSSPFVHNQIEIPAHGSYGALLFNPKWKARRAEILSRDLNRCTVCNGFQGLQVHHRQYHFIVRQNQFKLPWDYENRLLITLCEVCHKRGHNKYKVPTINI